MYIALCLILIAVLYFLGYKFSVYTAFLYIEPEELEEYAGKLPGSYRRQIVELYENPRNIIQLTVVFKSFTLILISFVAILCGFQLITLYNYYPVLTVFVELAAVWALYLIFLEYLPRRRAVHQLDNRAVRFLPFLAVVYLVFKPGMKLYNRIFSAGEMTKIPEEQKEDIIERAIESLADQAGAGEPIMEKDEKEMIGHIFQLDVTEVREVMVPRMDIVGVDKEATQEDIRHLTKRAGFSRYPVYDESPDEIIGILYVKDLFTDLPNQSSTFDLTNYMRKPFLVPESKMINDLLTDFKANKIHIAIVIDEYGGTSGLITLEDILEEIVGDIQDEYDFESAPVVRLPDNSVQVNASVHLEELLEELNLDYDLEEFETVGGLIYDLVGSVPSLGTRVKWNEILFEVIEMEGQRIEMVKAWVKKPTEH